MEFLKRKKKRETEKREKGEKEEMKKRKEKGEKEEKKKAKKKKVRKVKGGKDGRRQSEKGGKKYLPSTSKEKCGSSSHASYFNSDGFDEKEWMTFSEEEKKDEVEYFTALQKWEKSYTKPTPAEADLLLAAENGNLKEVKRTIEEEGASVHIRSRDCGWTPLHLASSEPEVVQFLLKCGADPNATEHRHPDFLDEDQPVEIANRLTPLLFACSHGCLSSVKMMVEKGGDLSRLNCDGETALHLAVEAGDMSLIRYLVNYNSKLVTTPDSAGLIPLGGLIRDGNVAGMKLFFKHGAEVDEGHIKIADFFKQSQMKQILLEQLKVQKENSSFFQLAPQSPLVGRTLSRSAPEMEERSLVIKRSPPKILKEDPLTVSLANYKSFNFTKSSSLCG